MAVNTMVCYYLRIIFEYLNNNQYVGELRGEKRWGKGKQVWPDGSSYEGDWEDNKANGKGIFRSSDGSKYEGQWEENIISGKVLLIVGNI